MSIELPDNNGTIYLTDGSVFLDNDHVNIKFVDTGPIGTGIFLGIAAILGGIGLFLKKKSATN